MPINSVVLTPGSAYTLAHVPAVIDLTDMDVSVNDWTPRTALQIAAADPAPPLLLVLTGTACAFAPHLGFAQRSARRTVGGYVLVDPVLPRPGAVSDWPDAPVTVVVTSDADQDTRSAALGARLRGWDVVDGDPSTIIAEIAARP
ncbi:MAG: hypothetical protein NWR17_02995 [Candidatus Nanopelagicales bacterium]|jgi:hypothetical protein|nr:hypothetical protein [Candidatus Nanopelagicales bacterium]MDP4906219.1 hypothetical protein [Candidatus Nanopelagicales bacterium]MDP4974085.1 hypothetical protein [Candidatus Nanopelagicales bacterium]